MTLPFTKMHGLGNDFIVIDNTRDQFRLTAPQIRSLADRRLGIGFDQLLVVEQPTVDGVEFDYRIYNADGGEVEHCGNGARCFALYVRDKGLTQSATIPVNTTAGVLRLRVQADNQVTVDMGVPDFTASRIPIAAQTSDTGYSETINVAGEAVAVQFDAVAIGNPHAVIQVDDIDTAPVESWGPVLESHPFFPNRVNVGFMQIVDASHIKLRVFERGVGETRACGTGACAAAAVGIAKKALDKKLIVTLPGGDLTIYWPNSDANIEMTGPCTKVFEGQTVM